MKKEIHRIPYVLIILALLVGLLPAGAAQAGAQGSNQGKIVVANRGSGNISVIEARTGTLIATIDLPQAAGEATPEPMYVVYTRVGDRFFVGDRSNNRVIAFDADDFSVLGTAPAGNGVFHMWADERGRQLWINNDIDKTTTVIDPGTLAVLATVPTPADLVAQGGKPHDVILDPKGRLAYVSVLGLPGANDYVVQFSTETFLETGRAAVGKDPHLSLNRRNRLLYVPTQGSNAVYILNRNTMAILDVLTVPGAHGAGMSFNGKTFYTTNLPGGGTDALFTIDTRTNEVVGEAVDSPYAVPHNIALTPFPDKLYLTHSGGASDTVTFYNVSSSDPIPVFAGEVTVGLNPFGLSYVP
jgi:DNA-binding beta-propeller fold protein YncE